MVRVLFPAPMDEITGGKGATLAAGVPTTAALATPEKEPLPLTFTDYETPLVRPVIVMGLLVLPELDQLDPLSVEYS